MFSPVLGYYTMACYKKCNANCATSYARLFFFSVETTRIFLLEMLFRISAIAIAFLCSSHQAASTLRRIKNVKRPLLRCKNYSSGSILLGLWSAKRTFGIILRISECSYFHFSISSTTDLFASTSRYLENYAS